MNILIDLRPLINAHTSGVTVYITNLTKQLLRSDRKNNYYFFYNSWQDIDIDRTFFRNFHLLRTRIPNRLLNISMALLRWPKIDILAGKKLKKNIDICFFMDPRPAPVSKSVKKVVTFHDLSFYHYPNHFSFKTRLWHRLLRPKKEAREADHIIAVSDFCKNELEKIYKVPSEKITTIHHGISRKFRKLSDEEGLLKLKEKYDLQKPFILTVSAIEPRKNIQKLIKAVAEFNNKHAENPRDLLIVGRRNPSIFNDPYIEEADFVKFLGYVPLDEKIMLYNLAEIYAGVSFYEGFGFPFLEALKCGVPVVASNTSAISEILNEYAFFTDPYDVNEIVKALEFAILQGKDGQRLAAAQEYARKFSWRRCAEKTVKVFEKIVK